MLIIDFKVYILKFGIVQELSSLCHAGFAVFLDLAYDKRFEQCVH